MDFPVRVRKGADDITAIIDAAGNAGCHRPWIVDGTQVVCLFSSRRVVRNENEKACEQKGRH